MRHFANKDCVLNHCQTNFKYTHTHTGNMTVCWVICLQLSCTGMTFHWNNLSTKTRRARASPSSSTSPDHAKAVKRLPCELTLIELVQRRICSRFITSQLSRGCKPFSISGWKSFPTLSQQDPFFCRGNSQDIPFHFKRESQSSSSVVESKNDCRNWFFNIYRK